MEGCVVKNKARTVISWILYGLALAVYWCSNNRKVRMMFRAYQWLMDKSQQAQRTDSGPWKRFE
jgi:hypothetical protein